MKKRCTKVCGNPNCCISTGIHEGLTFGSGALDFHGFWEKPCSPCARAWERAHPKSGPCWPFADVDLSDLSPDDRQIGENAT